MTASARAIELTCKSNEMCYALYCENKSRPNPPASQAGASPSALARFLSLARYPAQRICEQITVRACCESRQKAVRAHQLVSRARFEVQETPELLLCLPFSSSSSCSASSAGSWTGCLIGCGRPGGAGSGGGEWMKEREANTRHYSQIPLIRSFVLNLNPKP